MYCVVLEKLLQSVNDFKNSQEGIIKKRVSFDIPMSIEEIKDEIENEIVADNKGDETNDTIDIQFNLCLGGHDNYPSNKDMILKKDNLELSPQFVYGKNIMMLEKVKISITL